MRKYIYIILIPVAFTFVISCGEKKNEQAIQYINDIQSLYDNGAYSNALQKIDSVQILFPKAFQEIKKGLALKQAVRKALNQKHITDCDSLLAIHRPKIDSIKQLFSYQKDKEDNTGVFIPKSIASGTINSTMLRAGVNEDGAMYIESVYVGGQLHNKVGVITRDKRVAESLPINDDGFNFRFSNLGQQYEVIRVTPVHDNGLAEFIYTNASTPLTVQLKGKNTLSYSLSNIQKKAIADSYLLSSWIHQQDSLLMAKDKAMALIEYLDSKTQDNPERIKE